MRNEVRGYPSDREVRREALWKASMSKVPCTSGKKRMEKMKERGEKLAKIRSQHLGTKRSAIEFHHGILIARLLPDSVILPSLFLLFPCKRWRRYGLRWKGKVPEGYLSSV